MGNPDRISFLAKGEARRWYLRFAVNMGRPRSILLALGSAACVHLVAGAQGCCSALSLPPAEVKVRGVLVDESGTPVAGARIGVTGSYSGESIVSTGPFEGGPQTDQDGAFEVTILLPTGTCPPLLSAPLGPYGYTQLDELEIRSVTEECTQNIVVSVAGDTIISANGDVIELQDPVEMPPCQALKQK